MTAYIGQYASDGVRSFIAREQYKAGMAPAPPPSPCSGCRKAGAAPAPAAPPPVLIQPAPAASSPGMAAVGAGATITRTAEQQPTAPRDPRELLAWLEENGGLALWIVLAVIVLAVWSRKGGGSQTWR